MTRRIVLILALSLLATTAFGQREAVDKIAVVVGDDIILASELASQIQMVAFQTGQRPKTESEVAEFQKRVLEEMISDRLFLMEAEKDTLINIRPEEVRQALDEHIARVSQNFPTEEAFLEALAQEGLTLRGLERRYEDDIRNNLLRQRFIQRKLYSVNVSRYEVEQFYDEFKDSIPNQPEAVHLAHILLEPNPTMAHEDSVREYVAGLRQRILDGADFATIASQYSTGGSGANGGDLGFISRDDVVPEFARAAFQLTPGDISGVIRTPFGYHVIKCEEQRGDRLHLRHLLVMVEPTAADTARTIQLADSLIQEVNNGAEFSELAKAYSNDDESRANGGELGWFALTELPAELAPKVVGWTTPGEVRGPFESKYGFHILKLLDYQPEKTLSLDNDFDRIKELARQDKTGKSVDDWISELKNKTYIDYRIDL